MTITHTALAAAAVGLTGLLLWAYWMACDYAERRNSDHWPRRGE